VDRVSLPARILAQLFKGGAGGLKQTWSHKRSQAPSSMSVSLPQQGEQPPQQQLVSLCSLPGDIFVRCFRGRLFDGMCLDKRSRAIVRSSTLRFQSISCPDTYIVNLFVHFPLATIGIRHRQFRRLPIEYQPRAVVVIAMADVLRVDPRREDPAFVGDVMNLAQMLADQPIMPAVGVVDIFFLTIPIRQFGANAVLPLTNLINRLVKHEHLPTPYLYSAISLWAEVGGTIGYPHSDLVVGELLPRAVAELTPQKAFDVAKNCWNNWKNVTSGEVPEIFINFLIGNISRWVLITSGVNPTDIRIVTCDIVAQCLTDAANGRLKLLRLGVLELACRFVHSAEVPLLVRQVPTCVS
jgi:hypothetical protein